MQRYFIENRLKLNQSVQVASDQARQMQKVLRYKKGDEVICIDPYEKVYLCRIEDIDKGILCPYRKLEENNELDVDVTLIYGLPKNDKFEYVLQKTTELGVSRIVPFLSKRSVIKTDRKNFSKKYVRYNRILKEASEQSGRLRIPFLEDLITIEEIDSYLSDYNLVAYEEASKQGESSNFNQIVRKDYHSLTIIVGPEGGFEQGEVDYMKNLGIVECSLGKRILRSETAPLYMMSVIGFTRELMK